MGSTRRPAAWTLAVALALCGCGDDDTELFIDVRTDLVAGVEFRSVLTEVFDQAPLAERDAPPERSRRRPASRGDPFDQGLRAAELQDLTPGVYHVRVRLLDASDRPVLQRLAIVTVRGTSVFTIPLTRNCRGVSCPAVGDDPTLLACLDGQCVDPRCTEETPEHCGTPTCIGAPDCPATASCAESRCEAGVCVAAGLDDRCAPTEWCNPDTGCTPLLHDVVVGIEGTSASFLYHLAYDPSAPAGVSLTRADSALRLDEIGGSDLRALASLSPGRLLAGSGGSRAVAVVGMEPLAVVDAPAFDPGVDNFHGACALPGGNVIAGEYTESAGARVVEYEPLGDGYALLRTVFETTLAGGTLSHCVAPADDEIYAVEMDAASDSDGDLLRLTRSGDVWDVTNRFDISSFATDVYGTGHRSALFSFALHGTSAYAFPVRRHEGRIDRLIRCPLPDIDASRCDLRGTLPPDAGTSTFGPDNIQAASAVPGTDQIIFATSSKIYRYHLSDDRWEEVLDMWAAFDDLYLASGEPDSMRMVRHLVIE